MSPFFILQGFFMFTTIKTNKQVKKKPSGIQPDKKVQAVKKVTFQKRVTLKKGSVCPRLKNEAGKCQSGPLISTKERSVKI